MSQCLFKDNNPSVIVAVQPPHKSSSKSGLSHGALIGIIVAAVVLLLVAGSGAYIFIRYRKKKAANRKAAELAGGLGIVGIEGETEENRLHRFSELMGTKPEDRAREMEAVEIKPEMDGEARRSELPSPSFPSPMSPTDPIELDAAERHDRRL